MSEMDFRIDATGNVGKDPEQSYTPKGKLMTKASLAVTVGHGDYKHTEWIDLVVWGEKPGNLFSSLVQKGTTLRVIGVPQVNAWVSKQDGSAKAQFQVTVNEFRVLKNGKPRESEEESENPYEAPEE